MDLLIIEGLSHTDHSLTEDHIAFLREKVKDRPLEFIGEAFPLPNHLPSLPSGLYGPVAGDGVIPEEEVHYAVRGARSAPSRMIAKPHRESRVIVLVAVPRLVEGQEVLVLATAYGGPCLAPREPHDALSACGEGSPEHQASIAFWKAHALASLP